MLSGENCQICGEIDVVEAGEAKDEREQREARLDEEEGLRVSSEEQMETSCEHNG